MVVLNLRGDCLARTATNFQQGMTDKRFLELEIRAWLHSPARKRQLAAEAVRRLKALPGVEVFTPANGPHPTGVVSFRAAGRDCEELAEALGRRGIALRAGLHCAPLAHRTAGTLDTGTVRLSLSDFNTPAQIEKLAQELHQLFRETVR